MKSLVRSARNRSGTQKAEHDAKSARSGKAGQAQCCAKVSKTVAGCHD